MPADLPDKLCKVDLLIIVAAALMAASQAAAPRPAEKMATATTSPDGRIVARVYSSIGVGKGESRVEIRLKNGPFLRKHDFFSPDGQRGYGVNQAQWTENSRFLVMSMTNTGGHSPMHSPVVFWSRTRNAFYELRHYTAEAGFKLMGADRVQLETWPGLQTIVISLHELRKDQLSAIR